VNYNQVVLKCQILQECFLQNFNMQKFQNMEHSNSKTFQGLSRTISVFKDFQGPGIFFPKFKDFQVKDPLNPAFCKSLSQHLENLIILRCLVFINRPYLPILATISIISETDSHTKPNLIHCFVMTVKR